eukprot:TRINITY_DN20434_c0_g1_i1.p1 TRINITY_DN20434_c0_g1~~TRINITY_DN20434_c0_g1_i1.p1  ORF type:complete len:279 (-),score=52.51 TRINITY_DN20434_c0_g1_i1:140-937(-)
MKVCGVVGGIAWPSTLHFYAQINKHVEEALGGLHSSPMLLRSINLQQYAHYLQHNQLSELFHLLCQAAMSVFASGADFLVLCSNTAHLAFDAICGAYAAKYGLRGGPPPVLHIADCTAFEMRRRHPSMKKVGLLGTIFTFTKQHITKRLHLHGYEVATPTSQKDQEEVMRIIERELSLNIINPASKEALLGIIQRMQEDSGIEGIILGCTELNMLLTEERLPSGLPVIDSSAIQIEQAANVQLKRTSISDYFPPGSHQQYLSAKL